MHAFISTYGFAEYINIPAEILIGNFACCLLRLFKKLLKVPLHAASQAGCGRNLLYDSLDSDYLLLTNWTPDILRASLWTFYSSSEHISFSKGRPFLAFWPCLPQAENIMRHLTQLQSFFALIKKLVSIRVKAYRWRHPTATSETEYSRHSLAHYLQSRLILFFILMLSWKLAFKLGLYAASHHTYYRPQAGPF